MRNLSCSASSSLRPARRQQSAIRTEVRYFNQIRICVFRSSTKVRRQHPRVLVNNHYCTNQVYIVSVFFCHSGSSICDEGVLPPSDSHGQDGAFGR